MTRPSARITITWLTVSRAILVPVMALLLVACGVASSAPPGAAGVSEESRPEPPRQPARDRETLPRGVMTPAELRAEPIRFELDLPYADTANPRQRLDVYLPAEPTSELLPVVLFLHGGGWHRGDKATGAGHLVPLVASGKYAGVSAGYRLSGEATWPAQLEDVAAAIRWVRAHAGDRGLDAARIAVWGRSAGGQLALMLGLAGGDEAVELNGGVGPHTGPVGVRAIVNYFGVTDLPALLGQDSVLDRSGPEAPEARLLGGPLPENIERARAASPLSYVTPADPPVLTLHGTADRVVPFAQAALLHRALTEARVPSYLVPVTGAGHGGFPAEALLRVEAFLDRYLLGEDIEISTAPMESPSASPTADPEEERGTAAGGPGQ